uniref:Uncharacterized protein n=1 Tax=Setaria digitata TaxID=48799 RepID=A0A915Q2T9_9BILA
MVPSQYLSVRRSLSFNCRREATRPVAVWIPENLANTVEVCGNGIVMGSSDLSADILGRRSSVQRSVISILQHNML